ncbi:MAG TPA: glycosyltransferase [Burkholderiaceae bacterium]|jgi:glycosyltransferase involved in cell wall biosynthesis
MVAYHLPPLAGSSGIQRTLRFAQNLPGLGWQPLLLTVHPRAYEKTSDDLLADLPAGIELRRAFALDTARHLTLKGRYLGAMARPDRWISWRFDGVRQGMQMIREFKPDVIWSTYPIATAHVIGAELQRRSGLPWIADFRDPMAQPDYPPDPRTRASFLDIEAQAASQARYCMFTTPGAAQDYQQRYPQAASKTLVLENGFDEESFVQAAQALPRKAAASKAGPFVLLHSGIVYPSERDPTDFFKALSRLSAEGRLSPAALKIRFRAAVHEPLLKQLATEHGVQDFIEICPPIAYREALAEMMSVDGLLVMQASNCNAQIPAKTYEYLRAGRPILGLTDPVGDTAWALRKAGVADIVPLDSVSEIAQALPVFLDKLREGSATAPSAEAVAQSSRQGRTQELTRWLEAAAAGS